MTDAQLARLIAQHTARMQPAMARAWLKTVDLLKQSLSADEIAQLIERGQIDAILSDAVIDRALIPFREELHGATRDGFRLSVPLLPRAGLIDGIVGIGFDVLNPRVRRALEELESQILTTAKVEVRETVRQAIAAGVELGQHPRAIARGVRDVIGLAPNQAEAVRNFEKALRAGDWAKIKGYKLRDKTVGPRLAKGKPNPKVPLTEDQITRMVKAYRRRFEAFHAETVTRTATLNAYRTGQHEAFAASIESGMVDRARAMKTWVNVGDSRVRDLHLNTSTLHPTSVGGETVPFDARFSNGLLYPSEWNCRCHVRYWQRPAFSAAA